MKRASTFVGRAHELRSDHDYLQAGEYYSIAGHAYLATAWDSIRSTELDPTQKGTLLEAFVWHEYAATCYTLSNSRSRAENRARQALLGLEDVRTNLIDHPAWIGLTWELAADFRILAGLSGSDDKYAVAQDHYSELESSSTEGDVLGWITEPGFNETIVFLTDLALGVDVDLTIQELRTENGQPSLREHLEYKRENFAGLLEQLAEQGEWKRAERDLPTIEDGRRNDRSPEDDR